MAFMNKNQKTVPPVDAKTLKDIRLKENHVKTPQILRGFKDILPLEQPWWEYVRETAKAVARKYGFSRVDTPILEPTGLFKRTVGEYTDIVEKEMFSFIDMGGENVSLRPEATASIARMYIEHGMLNLPQPVQMFYMGPMFRYDRPQSGRYRQFHQFGFEIIGEVGAAADAKILLMTYNFFQKIGLPVNFKMNSIGCLVCRTEYVKSLSAYYKIKKNTLCKDCQRRLVKNPMRLLDCKNEACLPLKEDAPQIVDALCEDCQKHFMRLLEYLDDLEIPYLMDATLVRGLDYYNRTTFEIYAVEEGENPAKQTKESLALGGGGRYDYLIEQLGGRQTSAVGVAPGMERIILKLKERDIKLPVEKKPDILLAHIGQAAKVKAMKLFEQLFDEGFHVVENYVKDSLKAQLELADKFGCRLVLIIGQKEVLDNTVLIRDMEGGIQEVVDVKKLSAELRKKLEGKV